MSEEESPGERWERVSGDEFLKFDSIPEAERRHPVPDICAMIYLHSRFGGARDIITGSAHDIAWLRCEQPEKLTDADIIYLSRCGVHWDDEADLPAIFT